MAKLIKVTGYALLIAGAWWITNGLAAFYKQWGFSGLADLLSPFNVWNLIAVVTTFAPGALFIGIGEFLATKRQSARRIV
jgi:hypothetical protein